MSNIMERLKEETWPLHQQAERGALQQDLLKGKLARDDYREHLTQRLLIHRALENRLRTVRSSDPRIAAVVKDYQFHEGEIAEDIRFFGGNPAEATARPAAAKLIAAIEAAAPVSLLGFHYVFEGSTNGARYIAKALRGVWQLSGTDGTRYLDPYGEAQREKWAAFKEAMSAQPWTKEEEDGILEAAKATFTQMIEAEASGMLG